MVKVCRTCLEEIHDANYSQLVQVLEHVVYCIPEMSLDLMADPVVCSLCVSMLQLCFNFKRKVLNNEQRYRKLFQKQALNKAAQPTCTATSGIEENPTPSASPCCVENGEDLRRGEEDVEGDHSLPYFLQDVDPEMLMDIAGERVVIKQEPLALDQEVLVIADVQEVIEDVPSELSAAECPTQLTQVSGPFASPELINMQLSAETLPVLIPSITLSKLSDSSNEPARSVKSLAQPAESVTAAVESVTKSMKRLTAVTPPLPLTLTDLLASSTPPPSVTKSPKSAQTAKPAETTAKLFENMALTDLLAQSINQHPKSSTKTPPSSLSSKAPKAAANTYTCDKCKFRTASRRAMVYHTTHHGKRKFTCKLCDFSTLYVNNLRRHVRIHSYKPLMHCNSCKFRTISRMVLSMHMKGHRDDIRKSERLRDIVRKSERHAVVVRKNEGLRDSVRKSEGSYNVRKSEGFYDHIRKSEGVYDHVRKSEGLRADVRKSEGHRVDVQKSEEQRADVRKSEGGDVVRKSERVRDDVRKSDWLCAYVRISEGHRVDVQKSEEQRANVRKSEGADAIRKSERVRDEACKSDWLCADARISEGQRADIRKSEGGDDVRKSETVRADVRKSEGHRDDIRKSEWICADVRNSDGLRADVRKSEEHRKDVRKSEEQRLFKCDQCSYAGKTRQYLYDHKRVHSDVKRYKCSLCSFATKHSGNLTKHMRRKHEGKKALHAVVEHKVSSKKVQPAEVKQAKTKLAKSKLANGKLRSSIVPKEPKVKHKDKHSVVNHRRKRYRVQHENDKNWLKCTQCDYSVPTKRALVYHIEKQHASTPFGCFVCQYNTPIKSNLLKHLRRHLQQSQKPKAKASVNKKQLEQFEFVLT